MTLWAEGKGKLWWPGVRVHRSPCWCTQREDTAFCGHSSWCVNLFPSFWAFLFQSHHTHTHTYIYIYIYIYAPTHTQIYIHTSSLTLFNIRNTFLRPSLWAQAQRRTGACARSHSNLQHSQLRHTASHVGHSLDAPSGHQLLPTWLQSQSAGDGLSIISYREGCKGSFITSDTLTLERAR